MELVEETKDCTIPTPYQPYKGITLPETPETHILDLPPSSSHHPDDISLGSGIPTNCHECHWPSCSGFVCKWDFEKKQPVSLGKDDHFVALDCTLPEINT